jgi:hypothetical protein
LNFPLKQKPKQVPQLPRLSRYQYRIIPLPWIYETGVTLKQGNLKLNTIPTIDGSIKNEWNIAIASYPIELAIKAGGYSGEYEFGGLSLTDLHISDGAATVKLKFSTPNAVAMNSFRYETGASNITMEKLANANFQTMIFRRYSSGS